MCGRDISLAVAIEIGNSNAIGTDAVLKSASEPERPITVAEKDKNHALLGRFTWIGGLGVRHRDVWNAVAIEVPHCQGDGHRRLKGS